MQKTTNNKNINLIESIDNGKWLIRWNLRNSKDDSNIYTYEEETLNHKPSMEEVKDIVISSINKETEYTIYRGFIWNSMRVKMSLENLINFKAIFDRVKDTLPKVDTWDLEHPDLAGISFIKNPDKKTEDDIGSIPSGRPKTFLPVLFKLGDNKNPNYFKFNTLELLEDFYDQGLRFVLFLYNHCWNIINNYNWEQYKKYLE